jgi:hypothetical protein
MAESKTKPTKQSVEDFIRKLPDKATRDDCTVIAKMMAEATKAKGVMWGTSIAGFGSRKIKYANGKEADWPVIAFSPRKANLTLYLSLGRGVDENLLAKLGKHKMGMGCLYIKRLSDVDEGVLKKLIKDCAKTQKSLRPGK